MLLLTRSLEFPSQCGRMLGIAIISPTFCSSKTVVHKLFEVFHPWQHDTGLLETRANYSFFLLDVYTSDKVQKLNHANAFSNYSLPQIAPTFNAGRCIVTKQEIINMFHFWMSSINMHELFSSHKNSLHFNGVRPPSLPFGALSQCKRKFPLRPVHIIKLSNWEGKGQARSAVGY